MSKFQLKRLVGWVFLQIEMKCETKIIPNSTGTNAKLFRRNVPHDALLQNSFNDFAPPTKLAARAVDKKISLNGIFSRATALVPIQKQITRRFILKSSGKISQSVLIS